MKKNIKFWSLLFLLGSFAIFSGCSDDDEPTGSTDAATARFSYEVDADNYLKVTFTNESVNADVSLLNTPGINLIIESHKTAAANSPPVNT